MSDITQVLKAAAFAAEKHRTQKRKDEVTPYINHPLALACVLAEEGGITDAATLCGALLHDTVEDTETTFAELAQVFGSEISALVSEVTDDKRLDKAQRKLLQIEHAAHISDKAKRIKLADKICNLRDMTATPPNDWPLQRCQEYFDWARAVIDQVRGVDAKLARLFDAAYLSRP